jgi:hypothetical protein
MTIANAIVNYFEELRFIHRKYTFTMSDLTAYVRGISGTSFSPESAPRTLRKLRSKKVLNYTVTGNGETYTIVV